MRIPESRKDDDEIEEKPGTYIASPVPRAPRESKASARAKSSSTSNVQVIVPVSPVDPIPAPAPLAPAAVEEVKPVHEEHPPVTVQVKELIMGGTDEEIDEYRRQIHSEDPRANMLSISLAPAYFYDGSSSNYSFRNYHSDGMGFGLGMNVWLTPFFGVQSRYFSSVAGSVRDNLSDVVPVDVQEFDAGIRFRKHFGYTRRSAQLIWGFDYHDSSTKISKDALSSIGHKTSGVGLVLEGIVPSNVTYAHTFEVDVRPWQHHSEQKTGVIVKSGTKNQSSSVGLSLGGQWTLDRRNQVFWKTQYSVEKNLFDGDADTADAHGRTPNGVDVTNSLAIFYFGFKWGS